MAFTYVERSGDGSQKSFTFSFEGQDQGYIREEDIVATVNGVEAPFTLTSSNTLEFDTAPPVGDGNILIRRIMPKDLPYADFQRGNNFGQEVLNNSFLQLLYVVQELLDGYGFTEFRNNIEMNGNTLTGIGDDLDMNGFSINRLADGVSGGDAVNLKQLQNLLAASSSGLIARLRETRKIATAGQTVFNLSDITYVTGVNNINVLVNGVAQVGGIDFEETDSTTITFFEGLQAGDSVDIYVNESTTTEVGYAAQILMEQGGDTVNQAVNKRTIFVGSVAELEALTGPVTNQEAIVQGVPFIYDGAAWVPSQGYVIPECYGGNDTAAWQSAFDSGVAEVRSSTGGSLNTLVIPSTLRSIKGVGFPEIQIATDLTRLFQESGLSDLTITGFHFKGFPSASESSSSRLMEFTNSDRVLIYGNKFSNCPERPIQMIGCTKSDVNLNDFTDCSNGPWFVGCKKFSLSGNKMTGSQQADGTFKVGFGLGPNDATYGDCEDVAILGNQVHDLQNSQGYLIHSGRRILVDGNISTGCSLGIDFNPIDTNDVFEKISITNNTVSGVGGAVAYTPAGDNGITAYATSVVASQILISGNNIRNFNNKLQGNNLGGIACVGLEDAVITNNTVEDCFASGINFDGQDSTGVQVQANKFIGITGSSGAHACIRIDSPTIVSGVIENNLFVDSVRSYRIEGALGDFPDLYIRNNTELGSLNASGTETNANYENYKPSVDDPSPSVANGISSIRFSDTAANTVTTLDDGHIGQVVTLTSNNSNTTLSEDSDGGGDFKLSVSTNFSLTVDNTIQVVFDGAKWQEVSRSVN